jgi:hypothetical protein
VTVSSRCTWPSSSCNSWDSSNAFSHQFTCANTTAFQQNRSYLWCCALISLNTLQTSSYMIPHLRTYMSTMKAASYLCVCYILAICWNLLYKYDNFRLFFALKSDNFSVFFSQNSFVSLIICQMAKKKIVTKWW